MNDSLETVSLVKCLSCGGTFVNPVPVPGDLQYSASTYAMTRRLVWSYDKEDWICPDCNTARDLVDLFYQEEEDIEEDVDHIN